MTTLRDRIAVVLLQYTNTAPANAPGTADAILALFRDEAPPSDEELLDATQWDNEEDAIGGARMLVNSAYARGYAKSEAERAELQRRLDETDASLMLAAQKICDLRGARDAALDELRQLKAQPRRATETALMRAERAGGRLEKP